MESKPIDHECTPNAVCPYCGYEDKDSWELGNGTYNDGHVACGECGQTFLWYRDVEVSFSTDKCPCLNDEGPHKWRSMQFDADGKVLFEHRYKCGWCNSERVFPGETRKEFESK